MRQIPEQFLERLKTIVGSSVFGQIGKTFVERPTSFRVNTLKAEKSEVRQALDDAGFKVKEVPWYSDAFILMNKIKRELMELPVYTEGKIYIQSLASMVPPLALGPKAGEKVLDLTAAPGSKTSQLAALMSREAGSRPAGNSEGKLVANDNNKPRFFKLKHNLELLGATAALRMEDGSRLCGEFPEYFDKILLDAPCSAEARFIEGDPKTYGYWSERKIKEMAYKQRKLLFSAWHALKPGGTLVYSTCTFAPEENEAQVSRLLARYEDQAEMLPVQINSLKTLAPVNAWKSKDMHPAVRLAARILPTGEIEGFFIAKIRKQKTSRV